MINQFIKDQIHLTEGERFIKYWWLWLIITVICFSVGIYISKDRSKK